MIFPVGFRKSRCRIPQIMENRIIDIHESIRKVEVTENEIILHTKPKNEYFAALVDKLAGKMQKTLDYCRDVAQKRSDLVIKQRKIVITGQ